MNYDTIKTDAIELLNTGAAIYNDMNLTQLRKDGWSLDDCARFAMYQVKPEAGQFPERSYAFKRAKAELVRYFEDRVTEDLWIEPPGGQLRFKMRRPKCWCTDHERDREMRYFEN